MLNRAGVLLAALLARYPGEDNFYGLLNEMIAGLKRRQNDRC